MSDRVTPNSQETNMIFCKVSSDKVYGYYAGYTRDAIMRRAYSDINSSIMLRFEKVEKSEIPADETIHNCELSFEDARELNN